MIFDIINGGSVWDRESVRSKRLTGLGSFFETAKHRSGFLKSHQGGIVMVGLF